MLAMTQQQMRTIQQCLVCQEGIHPIIFASSSVNFFFSTHRIIAISTISRADHGIAQTRELACTKVVVPQAVARGIFLWYESCSLAQPCAGLNVVEVAHDIQQQVSKYISSDLKMVNSYDTWHGNSMH